MANGAPMPGWVTTVAQLTAQVGVPTVFSAVLLWFVLTRVTGTLEAIEANEARRTAILLDVEEKFVAAIAEQTADLKEALREHGR